MKKNFKKIKKNGGAAMLISVIFFLFISLAIISGLVSPTIREFKISADSVRSKQSYFLSESGVEDAYYRVKKPLTYVSPITLSLNGNTATTTIAGSGTQKTITAVGDVSSRQRTSKLIILAGSGVGFNYGVQTGQGGFAITDGKIIGNVYSNGPITATANGDNRITGTAISANSPALVADQTNGSETPSNNVIFANANGTQDIAQSFQLTSSNPLSKIQLYIKRTIGAPNDATIKIVSDAGGSPSATVLASGTLSASSVSATNYGWIDVSFTTSPYLNIGTTYWLVVDASTSSTKYYTIGASSGGYANGLGKIGQQGGTWNSTTPVGLDYYFSIFLGGINGSIIGGNINNKLPVGTVSGTAQAHTVNYISATGNIYCATGTGNNKSCLSQTDPVYTAFPISDANIQNWKDEASAGGTRGSYTVSGNPSPLPSIGPKKIDGDLTVSSNTTLYVTGPLWVTGNLSLNPGHLYLSPSYETNDGVIIVDGTITIGSGGSATGSGVAGSYFLLIDTNASTSAVSMSGNAGAIVVYAPRGTVTLSGGSHIKEVTAYRMVLDGNSDVTYEFGLADMNFSSGPSGGYTVTSWGEIE